MVATQLQIWTDHLCRYLHLQLRLGQITCQFLQSIKPVALEEVSAQFAAQNQNAVTSFQAMRQQQTLHIWSWISIQITHMPIQPSRLVPQVFFLHLTKDPGQGKKQAVRCVIELAQIYMI